MKKLLSKFAVFSILGIIAFSASAANAQSVAPQATFPADAPSLGAIPDSPAGAPTCGSPGNAGTPKDVTFTVAGQSTSTPLSDVRLSVSITHSWVGDLDVRLLGPGGTPSHVIFSRSGEVTATGCGDDSNLIGPYNFFDTAPASPTWWGAVATATTTVPAGDFRTSTPGAVAGGGANTLITPTFAGVTNPNGTWTLRIIDNGDGDTGSVTAASLSFTQSAPGDAANDINGDGRSDYTVVRNVGGGANGQMRWFYNTSGTADPTVALDWGLASDGFFLLEDYDGDGKDDVTVWRAGTATFYILQSQTMTARIDQFGQTGDDPTIAGDYDGDGKADPAVYRAGAMAGNQSTWLYRGSLTPANTTFIPWGQNGDFPSPGDYDGDGKYDFVIQRNNGGGQAAFWRRNNDGSANITVFGTPTDVIVPGDYDGDGKCDIATVRGVSGSYQWMYLSSLNSSINYITFGASATDFFAQGDYNGDGKTDVAIWRPSASPGGSFYVYRDTVSGSVNFFTFGQNGDYPVNNWNRH